MILGNTCTRNCRFCGVNKSKDLKSEVDGNEPERISRLIKSMGLDYAVITSVTRDDLPDAGARHFVRTLEYIHALTPDLKIEVLIPDFNADAPSLKAVIDAGADIIAHNIETVRRIHQELKPDSDYEVSLKVLRKIKEIKPAQVTKSSLLLGLGETEDEVISAMHDLKSASCDIITLGQYLAPSRRHYPVRDFISPGKFNQYHDIGLSLGFRMVYSGPLVRSSYNANKIYEEVCHV
jgi:lipoic acid synthetase